MTLTTAEKAEVLKQYAVNEKDTGSPEVQCALATVRIKKLIQHNSAYRKDHSSKKGLLALVNHRKKLLKYLQGKDYNRYKELIKRLDLRK